MIKNRIYLSILLGLGLFTNITSMEQVNKNTDKNISEDINEVNSNCYILNLPYEILLEIFHYIVKPYVINWNGISDFDMVKKEAYNKDLVNLALVCKSWAWISTANGIDNIFYNPGKPLSLKIKSHFDIKNELINMINKQDIYNSDAARFKDLILQGWDINTSNEDGMTLLIVLLLDRYTANTNIELIKFLLSKNININARINDGRTALMFVASWPTNNDIYDLNSYSDNYCDSDNYSDSDYGSDYGSDFDNNSDTDSEDYFDHEMHMLSHASQKYQTNMSDVTNNRVVDLILETRGLNLDAQDNHGNTALIYAVMNGNEYLLKKLIDNQVKDIVNKYGYSALDYTDHINVKRAGNFIKFRNMLEKNYYKSANQIRDLDNK